MRTNKSPYFTGHIDHCRPVGAGCFRLSGWLIDEAGDEMAEVWLEIGGAVHAARFQERQDVFDALGLSGDRRKPVGFSLSVRSSEQTCQAKLRCRSRAGRTSLVAEVRLRPRWRDRVAAFFRSWNRPKIVRSTGERSLDDFRWHWESPEPRLWRCTAGPVAFTGWIFSKDGQAPVRIRARLGRREVIAHRNLPRRDVVECFAAKGPVPEDCGFDLRFRCGGGFKWIRLEADFSDGTTLCLGGRLFWVGRWRLPVFRLFSRFRLTRFHGRRNVLLRERYRRALVSDPPVRRETDSGVAVDVVIPVYRGWEETRACLESVYASRAANRISFEIVVIDDAGPEPELSAYLAAEGKAGRITYLRNDRNLGFVGTVNRGMTLNPWRDCILLNSDTEVFHDWVDRLHACARRDRRIATVTPFSNNATLCSYPCIAEDNELPAGWSAADLDRAFAAANGGVFHDIPTGVGFCLYIRRDSLEAVGFFDQETFGKGYGEENDFCFRAALAGWRNVHLCDTFVYHKGAVSFAEGSGPRVLQAIATLNHLFPGYDATIRKALELDPARLQRAAVDRALVTASRSPRLLFVSNNRGGGTLKHIKEVARLLTGKATVFLLRPDSSGGYRVAVLPEDRILNFEEKRLEFPDLLEFCRSAGIERIHFHQLVDHRDEIFLLADHLELPFDVTVHDYYWFCPHITLTNDKNRYCGQPSLSECERCLRKRPIRGVPSVAEFRRKTGALLNRADRVICPSRWTATAIERHFPGANCLTVSHPEESPSRFRSPVQRRSGQTGERRVGILGALSPEKGADLLEAAVLDAIRRNLPLSFVLIGYAYRRFSARCQSRLHITGEYSEEEIDDLLTELNPDLIWFPALWPETYSYTLSLALNRELPVLAPNFGAFPERLKKRANSWTIPWDHPVSATNEILTRLPLSALPNSIPAPARPNFYPDEYLRGLDVDLGNGSARGRKRRWERRSRAAPRSIAAREKRT